MIGWLIGGQPVSYTHLDVYKRQFVDGNKRIGAHVMLVFLAINGIELDYTQEELIDVYKRQGVFCRMSAAAAEIGRRISALAT